jgi:hypothetical protein
MKRYHVAILILKEFIRQRKASITTMGGYQAGKDLAHKEIIDCEDAIVVLSVEQYAEEQQTRIDLKEKEPT